MKKCIYKMAMLLFMAMTAACSDDEQSGLLFPEIPRMVSSLPVDGSTGVRATGGKLVLEITYDQKIKLAEGNWMEKVEITRGKATIEKLESKDKVISLALAGCENRGNCEVYIPKGVVLAEDGTEAYAVRLSFTTDVIPVQQIKTELCNQDATEETRRLYADLVANYGKKMISGAMAQDSWNSDYAAWVNEKTGKLVKLNGFDYQHMPNSGKPGFVDYTNIQCVTDWYDNGNGLVSAMWHWNVPVSDVSESVSVKLWEGVKNDFNTADVEGISVLLDKAKLGDRIKVTVTSVQSGATVEMKENSENWSSLQKNNVSADETESVFVLDTEARLSQIKSGMYILGDKCMLTGVYLITDEVEYKCMAEETSFNAENVFIEGTWEQDVFDNDLAKLAGYLKTLQEAGIPVLWRPFHEASGGWFWWGAKGAETYKKLWIAMYDYLKGQHINNLIWVWTSDSEGNDKEWYPGDAYVDIIGRDLYGKDKVNDVVDEFYNLASQYPDKMIALTECGSMPDLSEMWNAGAKWAWFMTWYPSSLSDESDAQQHATINWWKDSMDQEFVVIK